MIEYQGKTAFITGGANGFGLALARQLGARGMKVMIGDINAPALEAAVAAMRAEDIEAAGVACDVTDRASMVEAAVKTAELFGSVHLLCNNAGVVRPGSLVALATNDWDHVLSVNVMGLVNGIAAFLPLMIAHKEPSHVINVASIAGHGGRAFASVYCASKAAVVSISESLRGELKDTAIGVTVLCPNFMKTQFFENSGRRPERFGGASDIFLAAGPQVKAFMTAALEAGDTPEAIASLTIRGMEEGRFYLFTSPSDRSEIQHRFEELSESLRWIDQQAANIAA